MFSLVKLFNLFGGLSFRQPDLLPNQTKATNMENVTLSEQFALTKRRGYQNHLSGGDTQGIFTFNNNDIGSGISTLDRLLAESGNLYKIEYVVATLECTENSVGEPDYTWESSLKLNKDTGNFELIILKDGVPDYTVDLGTGNENTPFNINDLKADLAGNTNFVLNTPASTHPAAFIPVYYDKVQSNWAETSPDVWESSITFTYPVKSKITGANVYTSSSDTVEFAPFSLHYAKILDKDWELIQSVQTNDVIYFTNKEDGLIKFDGAKVYKAGLPNIKFDTVDDRGTDNYQYIAYLRYKDDKDNIIESAPTNILTIDSTDVGVSLTIDLGNINTGYDADNIELIVARTIVNGTVFYEADPFTLTGADIFAGEFVIADVDIVDFDGVEYVFKAREGREAPKCAYIDLWRDKIVLTGNKDSVNTVYSADVEHLEGFDDRNSFLTMSKWGGPNTGLRQLQNQLFVFKSRSVLRVTGDVADGALGIQVDTMTDNGIGSLSQSSIIEVENRLYFLSANGIYSLDVAGVRNESQDLTPVFTRYTFRENRVISFYWVNENKVLFLLPEMGLSNNYAESDSRILVLDLVAGVWCNWSNLDFSCGISDDTQKIWFSGSHINEILQNKRVEDYADHNEAISWSYSTHWEALGEPSVPKKFNRIKVFSKDNELQTFNSDNFDLRVQTNHNLSKNIVSDISIRFGSSGGGFGLSPFGISPFGDTKDLSSTRRLAAHKANTLRVIFSNDNLHENVLISGFELEVATPYNPALRQGE